MDPISQAFVGACVPQSISRRQYLMPAALLGALSGMAPDLDVLIQSSNDPLLALEYHRQFTHSLLFIPFGALICMLVLHPLIGRRWQLDWRQSYLFCLLGYATHGLLDACTSYGTLLLWPFSHERIAWQIISVVDPVLTVILGLCIAAALLQRRPAMARLGVIWVLMFLGLGYVQRERAVDLAWQTALSRQHTPTNIIAKPAFGNMLLWKTIYETEHSYHIDAVRASRETTLYEGEVVDKLDIARDLPWLQKDSQQARDLERFRWFSQGYVAVVPGQPHRVTDIRYSLLPQQSTGLWAIELSPKTPDKHVNYVSTRSFSKQERDQFWQMIWGSAGP